MEVTVAQHGNESVVISAVGDDIGNATALDAVAYAGICRRIDREIAEFR
jgi:hypothetical protein